MEKTTQRGWAWHKHLNKPVFLYANTKPEGRPIVLVPVVVFDRRTRDFDRKRSRLVEITADWNDLTTIKLEEVAFPD